MRVSLTTDGSRGDVETPAGLAVQLRELGATGFDAPAAGGIVSAGVRR